MFLFTCLFLWGHDNYVMNLEHVHYFFAKYVRVQLSICYMDGQGSTDDTLFKFEIDHFDSVVVALKI